MSDEQPAQKAPALCPWCKAEPALAEIDDSWATIIHLPWCYLEQMRDASTGAKGTPQLIVDLAMWNQRADLAAPSGDVQEAARIAKWLANSFYPEQEFVPLDTLSSILSQIDNMVVGVYELAAPRVVWDAAINVLKANLCAPYFQGDCRECDNRMGDIKRLEAARDAAATGSPECEWKEDDNAYETECGKAFVLPDTPTALGMEFCCLCGRALKEVK